jgi:hypothetical protein
MPVNVNKLCKFLSCMQYFALVLKHIIYKYETNVVEAKLLQERTEESFDEYVEIWNKLQGKIWAMLNDAGVHYWRVYECKITRWVDGNHFAPTDVVNRRSFRLEYRSPPTSN